MAAETSIFVVFGDFEWAFDKKGTIFQKQIVATKIHGFLPSEHEWCLPILQQMSFLQKTSSLFETVNAPIQTWHEPTTLWDGQPVLGFMAETFLDDLHTIGFKDFNPMWTFPTTSVNQCWEPMTFGMAPWNLSENVDKQRSKEALQSQSPIAAFKACNIIQAIGIAHSKIVLPTGDSKGESKNRTYCPTTWNKSYGWPYAAEYANQLRNETRASALFYARNANFSCASS